MLLSKHRKLTYGVFSEQPVEVVLENSLRLILILAKSLKISIKDFILSKVQDSNLQPYFKNELLHLCFLKVLL